jgi:hypothetical protein
MNDIKLPLIAAALVAVWTTGPAPAMPLGELVGDQNLKQDVRLICHEHGRCYETRRRVPRYYEDEPYYAPRSYDYYAPSHVYYGGPGYYGYGGPGIGFSFGFGGHHRGW